MSYAPKVTIIIPVYNGSNFMAEAIEAALAQTYHNCEVIVINDGSRDNGVSERIALSYGDKIKYFFKENGGVSSALNYAFTKMTGEWFSWLSHDDLYYPEKIEKQVCFIEKLIAENPGINLNKITVRTATESIDKNGKVIKTPSYKDVPEHEKPIDTILNNIANYRLSGCSFLLPRTCVDDIGGFAENIRTVSDVEYWYRLLFAGYEFYCMPRDILVKNRSHGKQIGKIRVELFDREMNALFIWIADTMNQNPDYATTVNNEKLYFSLIRRRCVSAAEYVKKTYLEGKVSMFRFLHCTFWGVLRCMARDIYREIYVR